MRIYFDNADCGKVLEIFQRGNKFFIKGESEVEVQFKSVGGKNFYSFDGVSWNKLAEVEKVDTLNIQDQTFKVFRGFRPSGSGGADASSLVTQMPGKVVKVLVSKGDEVKQGETLLILEAMKMENEIKAGIDATIKEVHVSAGESIDTGHLMIELDV